jgi:AraC-like DNA-binding protein
MILFISFIGFLASFLLYLYTDKVNRANRFLAFHFFLNSLYGISHWASVLGDSENLRALFLIHYFPIYLLNTPYLYFYVRAVLTGKTQIQGWDYLHFLPSLIIFINIAPYSILPWQEKLNFGQLFHQNFGHIYDIYFPLVSFTTYFVLRSFLSLAYVIAAALILRKAIMKKVFLYNATLKSWLIVCLGLAASFNLILITGSIHSLLNNNFRLMLDEQGKGRSGVVVVMTILIISIYFFPKILYGLKFSTGKVSMSSVIELNKSLDPKNKEISEERLKQIDQKIVGYLPLRLYLTPGFSLVDLVKDIGVPLHVLSIYFNNYKGATFVVWKNQLRIEYAIQLMESGKANKYTLESLGEASGYKSRSNFIHAFKEQTGESPSAYLKRIG